MLLGTVKGPNIVLGDASYGPNDFKYIGVDAVNVWLDMEMIYLCRGGDGNGGDINIMMGVVDYQKLY